MCKIIVLFYKLLLCSWLGLFMLLAGCYHDLHSSPRADKLTEREMAM